jgi:multiple sugar transport system ATP-binding protein
MSIFRKKTSKLENQKASEIYVEDAVNDVRSSQDDVSKSISDGVEINFSNIGKKYEGRFDYTLENINVTINKKDFCVILGPSGCGKTTLLRMISGLNSITKGDLFFNGTRVNDLLPNERDIAFVFQSYALYPHMNVYDNMSFSLKLSKVRKDVISRRVKDAAKILNIEHLLYYKPAELSGGQRQRVALGRAIVRKPSIFLMDEPLSNLDAKLRESMRTELVNIHNALGTTTIYVTHDQLEAMTMSTKIILMNDGKIQQTGSPRELYERPTNLFTAKFIGTPTMNTINGTIKNGYFIDEFQTLNLDMGEILKKDFEGKEIIIGFRSEDVSPVFTKTKGYDFVIQSVELLGKDQELKGYIKPNCLLTITCKTDKVYTVGQEIKVILNMDRVHVFDAKTAMRIN